jgi:putative MATE family efflux protein
MIKSSSHDLTTGSIPKHLVRMTVPMIWGILAIVSFQLVDAYYISRLGTAQLAAISYTFPITYGIFSIFIGFGVATSSVISRMIGEGRTEDIKRVTSHALILVFLASLIIAAIGIPLIKPIFEAMGASDIEIKMIDDFMIPYFIGTFFISMPIVGNAALRAAGDAKIPAIVMTIAALTNALINPFLIFGLAGFPKLELTGAAIGTILANILAMSACLTIMHRRGLIDFTYLINFEGFKQSCRRILMIAVPVGLTGLLPTILGSTTNHLLSMTGAEAVAAYGAATRLEAFLLVILMALSIGMAPIIGQNWGAQKMGRVKETVKYALSFSVVWSIISAVILITLAPWIASKFSDDVGVQTYIKLYLFIIPITYFLGHIVHGWGSVMNAIGKPHISAGMLFIKIIVVSVPAIWIGYTLYDVKGVFIALAIVNIVTGILFHLWAWKKLSNTWIPKMA